MESNVLDKLIEKKKRKSHLIMEDYYLVVDYMLKHGADETVVKFFYALDSFGMSKQEVLYLALAMRDSGRVLTFNQCVFEKHSTGGVGDSTSVVLIPLIASLGYKIIKNTAKSLVFTNGSADRFGAIPNFNVKLSDSDIKRVMDETNACVLSHNGDMCPADRILFDIMEHYNLAHNVNFIASSIACKKLASGARVVLVDVKYGYASVIKKYRDALKAARLLKYVFNQNGVQCVITISNTVQTIGDGIGNAIEVQDAIDVLKGHRCMLRDVVTIFATEMIMSVNKHITAHDIKEMIDVALDNGYAYARLLHIVKSQGGSVSAVIANKVFTPYHEIDFVATKNGYVGNINAILLGDLVRKLCETSHDNNIGFRLNVKIGDIVHKGDKLLTFYYKNKSDILRYGEAIRTAVNLTEVKIKPVKVIKKVIH